MRLLPVLFLLALLGCEKERQFNWCGIKHTFDARVGYCFETEITCKKQHAVRPSSEDLLSCELISKPHCFDRFDCFRDAEVCKAKAAESGDGKSECKRAWPLKPIGMPD